MADDWDHHQDFERRWWGDCSNTYNEETKQLLYADRMGLAGTEVDGHWPVYDLGGRSVVDIGGGPTSLLLKCVNKAAEAVVVDPCLYPDWVRMRYAGAGIRWTRYKAEDVLRHPGASFDEAWCYNVLQHVDDPEAILQGARHAARVVRIFEWVNIPAHEGHPHELTTEFLFDALGRTGTVETFRGQNSCWGEAFYGVFEGTDA